ncbi:unnamed protein product [Peronospora belbahrii]|uniref:Uncharacterized protein n=1 Tax=Peronospora belbahrii TaxID=622444 RepID=A0ABN8D1Z7_9STRA|nr:unnamed protein product [Peronospora belbahrii]
MLTLFDVQMIQLKNSRYYVLMKVTRRRPQLDLTLLSAPFCLYKINRSNIACYIQSILGVMIRNILNPG